MEKALEIARRLGLYLVNELGATVALAEADAVLFSFHRHDAVELRVVHNWDDNYTVELWVHDELAAQTFEVAPDHLRAAVAAHVSSLEQHTLAA